MGFESTTTQFVNKCSMGQMTDELCCEIVSVWCIDRVLLSCLIRGLSESSL